MGKTPAWRKLSVAAAPEILEALAALLVEWGAGGTVEEAGGIAAFYVPEERDRVEALLARYASDLGAPVSWGWIDVPDEDWWESWKAHFRPTVVSSRLAVCPSWEAWNPPSPEIRVIRMDPGRAFGTGTHETTRLCLGALDRWLAEEPADTLLDVGSGSGILSIGASLLGVGRVVAVDVDPVASQATRENAARNGAADVIVAVCADLRAIRGTYPLVVANILYEVLLGLAPLLSERVTPGGRLLLSGMLRPELPSAVSVYARFGLLAEGNAAEGEWGALLLRKK